MSRNGAWGYAIARDIREGTLPTAEVCLCAVCRRMLFEGDVLADNRVYKLGELAYIELAHVACAQADDSGVPWTWDEPEDLVPGF